MFVLEEAKLKRILLAFSFLTLLLFICCTEEPQHSHTFSLEWSYDGIHHWHAATCNHDQKDSYGEHVFEKGNIISPSSNTDGYTEYVCKICQYTEQRDIVHPLSDSFSYNSEQHWHPVTCKHDDFHSTPEQHIFGDDVIISTQEGSRISEVRHSCTVCDYAFTENSSVEYLMINEEGYVSLKPEIEKESVSQVVIPSMINGKRVVGISSEAFKDCINLNEVSLPVGLLDICDSAFENDINLYSIGLPESLESIGDNCFLGCSKITSVMIPKNLKKIGESAFANCLSLSSFSIDSNAFFLVKDGVLYDKSQSVLVSYPAGKQNPYYGAFILPKNVSTIRGGAFRGSKIVDISLPATTIGDMAFDNCKDLKQVVFEKAMQGIGNAVFRGCAKLEEVYIDMGNVNPSRDNIIDSMFYGCNKGAIIYLKQNTEPNWILWNNVDNENALSVILTDYLVGDVGPSGGIVFYDKGLFSDGWRYLEACESELDGEYSFGSGTIDPSLKSSLSTAIGSGYANTQILRDSEMPAPAALACLTYKNGEFDDYYLPSRDELKALSKHVGIFRKGHYELFSNVLCWSSSYLSIVCLLNCFDSTTSLSSSRNVVPIRSF